MGVSAAFGALVQIRAWVGLAVFILFIVLLGSNSGSGLSYYQFGIGDAREVEIYRTKYCVMASGTCLSWKEAEDNLPTFSDPIKKGQDVCLYMFTSIMVYMLGTIPALCMQGSKPMLIASQFYAGCVILVSAVLSTISYSYLVNDIKPDVIDAVPGMQAHEMGGLKCLLALLIMKWILVLANFLSGFLAFAIDESELAAAAITKFTATFGGSGDM